MNSTWRAGAGANAMRLRVRTAVMGLLGLNGALPLHYTERIAAWEHATRDEGPRAFYDAFSSRQVALFYRAWRKYRVRGGADEHNRDRFLAQLVALAGAGWQGQGPGQPGSGLAFENLAYRVDLDAVRGVVTTMIQTEKYGTPLASALRVLSAEFRNERMMRAEEKAARLPAIMTVPLILFILPVLFVVILGPAACSISDAFSGGGPGHNNQ